MSNKREIAKIAREVRSIKAQLGKTASRDTDILLKSFFKDFSSGDPDAVSERDYAALSKEIQKLSKAGLRMDKVLITALASGDYDFGGGDDEETWLSQYKPILESTNKLDDTFWEVVGLLEPYWG